ncbi:formamidopyrimidine-DNA glycosylase [Brevibacterium siliguriense]|uniref:Formamidopyrimidine-DNA glycosylase n=1 Tax=Brevibacterium siliguriense TaxID=1136497 RepID=A0A1H1XST5_9MICO|nr:DNA-formamidopyrimidine glycosylase family protein [Brevibacterium siliguriense]SDT12101.1 formamidopyrimidine-DNA glycosylase [Brevibacterium siliguriense]
MPELPEVDALVEFLRPRLIGEFVTRVDIAELSLLKTVDPNIDALAGLDITEVYRRGRVLIIGFDGLVLVCRFARMGWLTWHDTAPSGPTKMGKGPLGMRVTLALGAAFDLIEPGSKKNAAVSLVRDPSEVPALASLCHDALSITVDELAAALAESPSRIKTVLEDQRIIAGLGNAYTDEILHTAKLSPFATAKTVDPQNLHDAIHEVLNSARSTLVGLPPGKIKTAKKRGFSVHGRTGETCPVCGETIAEVSFADKSLQYCPGCQTGGKKLSDRRMDRLLK